MLPTHVLIGLVFTLPVILNFSSPPHNILILVAIIGSIFPDIDILFGRHRKTLHYPMIGLIGTILSGILVVVFTTTITIGLFVFMIAFTTHCLSDILGTGIEPYPWKHNVDEAVYNHISNEWIDGRRIFAYDGSPRDLGIYFLCCSIILAFFRNIIEPYLLLIAILSVVAVGYTLTRRIMPMLNRILYSRVKMLRPVLDFLGRSKPKDYDERLYEDN